MCADASTLGKSTKRSVICVSNIAVDCVADLVGDAAASVERGLDAETGTRPQFRETRDGYGRDRQHACRQAKVDLLCGELVVAETGVAAAETEFQD